MRAGLLGCPHDGSCCLGYFRVRPETPCVENLAHRKRIILNDLVPASIYSPQQTFLSYLIDGYTAPSRCATIDSTRCRNNEPHIIIDLNRNYHVHGVVIHQLDSFSHLSQDDYISRFQLDRIVVYITRDIHLDPDQLTTSQCSFVTRTDYSTLSQCLHLQCESPIIGRYIHIQLFGIKTFVLILVDSTSRRRRRRRQYLDKNFGAYALDPAVISYYGANGGGSYTGNSQNNNRFIVGGVAYQYPTPVNVMSGGSYNPQQYNAYPSGSNAYYYPNMNNMRLPAPDQWYSGFYFFGYPFLPFFNHAQRHTEISLVLKLFSMLFIFLTYIRIL
ncbi:unnamed protein product [Adineta ricciae]|uniref:Uncharacterized protein n=1 Tax=Adineta ricciae TaxID=249248 RepID=A0A813ZMJ3_ADIRI|nr:unnamed protein product [Adineta ricciae]